MQGLVLEGGGVRGAYHIGAMRALTEHGYKFDGVVGTSIGAVNGAVLAQGDWDKIETIWQGMCVSQMLSEEDAMYAKLARREIDFDFVKNVGKLLSSLGAFLEKSTDKMRNSLRTFINEDKLRESPVDFGLVTFSLPDFEPHYFMKEDIPNGQVCDYVIASANYPLFKWQQLSGFDGKRFIDGGVYDNMPVNMLASRGYDEIVVIRTRNKKYRRKIKHGAKIIYIVPSVKLATTALEFTEENIAKYINMGYYDARRTLEHLAGFRYCVKSLSESAFRQYIDTLSTQRLLTAVNARAEKGLLSKLVSKVTDRGGSVSKSERARKKTDDNNGTATVEKTIITTRTEAEREIFERIRRELQVMDESDFSVFVYFLELFALAYGLEPYRIYAFDEFINLVTDAAKQMYVGETQPEYKIPKGVKSIKPCLRDLFYGLFFAPLSVAGNGGDTALLEYNDADDGSMDE